MPTNMILLIAMVGAMVFMMFRSQKKQQQQQQQLMSALKVGSSIITIGGLHGVVEEINTEDNTIVLDCEGVYLTFERWAVKQVKPATAVAPVQEAPETTEAPVEEATTETEVEETTTEKE